MGEFQTTGDKQPLNKTPIASPSADPRSGTFETTGDRQAMSQTPVQSPSANPKGGTYETSGEKVPLNRTPVKGIGSAGNLPMSERSIDQSKTAA